VDASNGQFAHCPQPERYGDKGYYLTWEDHQHQGILQSKDIGECCFFAGDVKKWLLGCDPFPDNYFELWDIYEEYSSEHNRNNAKKLHSKKTKEGKSAHAVSGGRKVMEKKDENGKSIHAVSAGRKLMEKKDENGKSVHGVEAALRTNAKKDEFGRSIAAMKTLSQVWESTIDGFRSNPGAVAYHNKAHGWDPSARIRIS